MGYNAPMAERVVMLVLRACLIAVVWALSWQLIRPTTQTMRVLRAAVLVFALLLIMAVVHLTAG